MRTGVVELSGNGSAEVEAPQDQRARPGTRYRKDIDGLRAIAVGAVIVCHLGLAPMGYLGVDIFFVISGYLITGIVIDEIARGEFSFARFYERRTRRIIPLALTTGLVALAAGLLLMLPDDLENLAQSVVATNLFANNILQAVTTKDYWDVVNDYKPMMHTWSLGVEEQFYIFWPAILILAFRMEAKWRSLTLVVICAVSLMLFLSPFAEYEKFYYLPFRLFELAAGGLVALAQARGMERSNWGQAGLLVLVVLLVAGQALPDEIRVIVAVCASCLIMAARGGGGYSHILENRILVYLGLISYSLYMWHQVVFAIARYAFVEQLEGISAVIAVAVTLVLSVLSYTWIERVFRDRKKTSLAVLCVTAGGLFLGGTIGALSVYAQGGLIRDVPELDLKAGAGVSGVHAKYNHRINELNQDFSTTKTKVLVVGNSFARDWANVLLESRWADTIEVSYSPELLERPDVMARAREADVIFWSEARPVQVSRLGEPLREKVYVVGTKNFGRSAGIFYNYRGSDYFGQRVRPDTEWLRLNQVLSAAYGDRYVDQMGPLLDGDDRVPVFTPEGKFISQDCQHLTAVGAEYVGRILDGRMEAILTGLGSDRPQGART